MNARHTNENIFRKKLALGLSNKLPYLLAQKIVLEGKIETYSLYESKSLIQIDLIKALGGGYTDKEDNDASR